MREKISRKEFIEKTLKTAVALAAGSNLFSFTVGEDGTFYGIIVNYNLCTGCRTCEIACSSFHNKMVINGKVYPGLPQPERARIRVFSYNPDLFIPTMCQFCKDSPCVNSCPSPVDKKTGKKALSKNKKFGNIIFNSSVCLHCGNCYRACKEKSVGIIRFDEENKQPYGFCDLCGGGPQCVKQCPYGALKFIKGKVKRKYYKMPADLIAKELSKKFYKGLGGEPK